MSPNLITGIAGYQKAKKILFLISDTGSGHRVSAEAIISTLKEIGGNKFNAKIIDFFREGNRDIDKLVKTFYSKSISNTSLGHGTLFHLTNNRLIWNAILPLYQLIYENIKNKIRFENPDLIISVHPLVNYLTKNIIAELNLNIPFIIVITDPITIHYSWIEPDADFFIVASGEAKKRLLKSKVKEDKIKLFGLPIRPIFYNHSENITSIKKRFGLKENKFTVLFSGGGEGGGKIYPIIKLLLNEKSGIQIVVVCGRNEKLKERLFKLPIKVIGYTNKMHELMSVVDLIVTKAGPATIEESIIKGLPIIITSYIIGQESGNIKYAKKRTRAYYENNSKRVIQIIKKEMQNYGKLKKISEVEAPVYKIAHFINEVLNKREKA